MDYFIRCLKQRVPNDHITIPNELYASINTQEFFLASISQDLQHNLYYFKSIFKKILAPHSNGDGEISDELYEIYIEKILPSVELSPFDTDLLQYQVTPKIKVKLYENPRLISGLNTTGHRTWEASVYLSYYLLNHYLPGLQEEEEVGSIMELGSGTGLVGISIAKYLTIQQDNAEAKAKARLIITDGDSQLVENLTRVNLPLNDIALGPGPGPGPGTGPDVQCMQYIWSESEKDPIPFEKNTAIDLCIGADITYDITILPTLVTTLLRLFKEYGLKRAIIACTIRNIKTIERFVELLKQKGVVVVNELKIVSVPSMFIDPLADFKILEIVPRPGSGFGPRSESCI